MSGAMTEVCVLPLSTPLGQRLWKPRIFISVLSFFALSPQTLSKRPMASVLSHQCHVYPYALLGLHYDRSVFADKFGKDRNRVLQGIWQAKVFSPVWRNQCIR